MGSAGSACPWWAPWRHYDHRETQCPHVEDPGQGHQTGGAIVAGLKHLALRFRRCVADLPGRPDIVFPGARIAVFVDGDFWHGWRFQPLER